jgi:hypothetical protein
MEKLSFFFGVLKVCDVPFSDALVFLHLVTTFVETTASLISTA